MEAAVGSYAGVREGFDAFADGVEAEYLRLDQKDDITEDESDYLTQLGYVRNLLDLIEHLVFTAP